MLVYVITRPEALFRVAPPDLNTTTGWETATSVVNSTVTTLPDLAWVTKELFEATVTPVRAGSVSSNVTLPVPVVTATPGFPARSPTTILYVTAPSVSLPTAVYDAVQVLPVVLT